MTGEQPRPGTHLEREIGEQPAALERLLVTGRREADRIASALRARPIDFVTIAARGTSDNAARYAQYLFGANAGLVVALAAPSLFTVYCQAPRLGRSLVIGVSQSGESPDVVAVVAEGHAQGAPTLAITNSPGSPLALAADYVLDLGVGPERSVAATKTYTAELMALAMLSAAIGDSADHWEQLAAAPAAVAAAVGLSADVAARAERYRYADRLVTCGRGFCYGTAFELALKLKETCYVMAEPYSPPDFLHGPVAIVHAGFPVLLVAPGGAAYPDLLALAQTLAGRGAELVAISDRAELLALARTPLRLPVSLPEWLAPIAAIVPGQLLALHLARAMGLDPDHPRGLSKVTRTE